MYDILQNVTIYSAVIVCNVISPIVFYNFPGISLRGGFGYSLKKSVCIMKNLNDCTSCAIVSDCPYAYIFETPNVFPSEKMKSSTHYPHPFSLTPLNPYPAQFNNGDKFKIKLSMFGKAVKYFPNILYALIELGNMGLRKKLGKYEISQIYDYTSGAIVYDGNSMSLNKLMPYTFNNSNVTDTLKIEFLTPCKIKANGKYQRFIDIENIIKNIKRKIENISYFFEGKSIILDMSNIKFHNIACVNSTISWEMNKRYSKRKEQNMLLGGYKGRAFFKGDVTPIYPLLKIGEAINIGSNTSFGFGAIQVDYV